MRPQCIIPDCGMPHRARSLCYAHYTRWWRHGDPLAGGPPIGATPEGRFWAKVDRSGSCWLWLAATSHGYGTFQSNGKLVRAHRYAYELLVGPIPGGLVIDHLCRTTACVNPEHLEPVTQRENLLRGAGGKVASEEKCDEREGE